MVLISIKASFLSYRIDYTLQTLKTVFLVATASVKRDVRTAGFVLKEPHLTFYPDMIVLKLQTAFIHGVSFSFQINQEVNLPCFLVE